MKASKKRAFTVTVLPERFASLLAAVRHVTGVLFRPVEARATSEERDLLAEEDVIAAHEKQFPGDKRAFLVSGASQMISEGYSPRTVSITYGEDAVREAEGLLTSAEWVAARHQIIYFSGRVRTSEASEASEAGLAV
jgi:hypothetical protein